MLSPLPLSRYHCVSVIAASALWLIGGCSVNEYSNPQRKSRTECKQLGGTPITDQFCLLPTLRDAAVDAASNSNADSGPGGQGGHADSGTTVYEHCSKEGQSELCYEGADQSTSLQPPCRAGTHTCQMGVWGTCEQQVLPKKEDCNGIDDDCDGRVDEELDTSTCDVVDTAGACAQGMRVCLAGKYQCLQVAHAQTDVCNGVDDDCDGMTDEGTQLLCYPAAPGCAQAADGTFICRGSCAAGKRACVDGAYAQTCEGAVTPGKETCTPDGQSATDEDCDGQFDEGCTCNNGTSCYTGSPIESAQNAPCHAGTQVCSDATHGTCTDEVIPQTEDCSNEGTDDDCDGVPDNIPWRGTSCADQSTAPGACKSSATWKCQDGQQTCVAPMTTGAEVCDGQGVDEDCDGKVDEGFMLDSDPNNCGACGVTCATGLSCCSGACVDTTSSNAHCSSCDNACASGETCCSSNCVDTKTDGNNCGVCAHACAVLNSCSGGSCKLL